MKLCLRVAVLLLVIGSCSAAVGQTPDRRKDSEYLDKQIKHISDADLFSAIDLERPGLAKVKTKAA